MIWRVAFVSCTFLALVAASVAVGLWLSYAIDARRLRDLAESLTEGIVRDEEKVRAINSFVHRDRGFARSGHYFALPQLGPTPSQILEYGGDCADRSRLLAAMLRQIGIRSSPAMLYPALGAPASHTVVLAHTESGIIAADPMYDLVFPALSGGYYDVRRMIADPRILSARLREERAVRRPASRLDGYAELDYRYDFITTINWRKYGWLEALANFGRRLGLEPRVFRRPAPLEDPKLAMLLISMVSALLFAILSLLVRSRGA